MTGAEKVKAWRLANPDKVRAMNARRREAHRAWCAANPERVRAHKRKSDRKTRTPEKTAYHNHRSRSRRAGIPAIGVTPAAWAETAEYFGGRCAYCLGPADQRDHVEPLCRGGLDTPENVVPCCATCNNSKHTKTLLGWIGGLSL